MRDRVWDRVASHQRESKECSAYDALAMALNGTSPLRSARVALALAIIMHAMLRDGTEFASA
jgi:hypothetical protein